MITKINSSQYVQNRMQNKNSSRPSKLNTINTSSSNNEYRPAFYQILPTQISFGASANNLHELELELLKLQKKTLIYKVLAQATNLMSLKFKKEEALTFILKAEGIYSDSLKEKYPQLIKDKKAEIKRNMKETIENISKKDCELQKIAGHEYDTSADWEDVLLESNSELSGFPITQKALFNHFAKPVLEEKSGIKAPVPPGVVLYGPDSVLNTHCAESMFQLTGSEIEYLETDAENFIPEVERLLSDAKERYFKDKTRTIIFVSDFDDLANTDPKNENVVNYLKTRLDRCSKTPDEHQQGFATTFFFCSENPNKLHKDLRKGKIGEFFGMNPTSKDYVRNLLQAKAKKSGTNEQIIDYDKTINDFKPDDKLGAYSPYLLGKVFDFLFEGLNQDGSLLQFRIKHVLNNLDRDISPSEYQQIKKIEYCVEQPSRSQIEVEELKSKIGIK